VLGWAGQQATPIRLEVRVAVAAGDSLVLSSGTRVSGGTGDDLIRNFDVSALRTMVDVEVTTLDALIESLPAGSELLVRVDAQPDARVDLEVPALLGRALATADERSITISIRTNSENIANSAQLRPEVAYWWEPRGAEANDALLLHAKRNGIHGIVVPQEAIRPSMREQIRNAGLRLAVDNVAGNYASALRPIAPDLVIVTR
jgi:hypothetical protein